MDCLTFLDRLAGLLEGRSTPSERAAAEEHAASCPACGELLRTARGDSAGYAAIERGAPSLGDDSSAAADMVRSVLARTTGPTCGRAEDQLCDFVDGALDPAAASLVAAHLDRCPSCSALAESLRSIATVLASLAELEPDPRLLPAVLNATSRRPRRRSRLATSIGDWSRVLLARPRFSLEAAYAGTLLFVLVFGNPAATLQAASARTMTVAEAGIGRVRTALPAALSSLPIEKTQSEAVTRLESLREGLSAPSQAIARATGGWWSWLVGDWAGTWNSIRSAFNWLAGEFDARSSRLRQALKSVFPSRTEPQATPGR